MATYTYDEKSTMIIRVEVGSGDDVSYKNRSFTNINPELSNDLLYEYADELGKLQSHNVNAIMRRNEFAINEE